MKWGLDSAYPPLDQLARFRDLGWSWYAGYVGGKAEHPWTLGEWTAVRDAGFLLLPVWVAPLVADAGHDQGVEDGNECLITLQALGLSGIVALDVENGQRPVDYASGFFDAVHSGSCSVVLYGTDKTLVVVGALGVEGLWLARWGSWPTDVAEAPIEPTYWQVDNGTVADFNIAEDSATFATLAAIAEPEAPSAPPAGEA